MERITLYQEFRLIERNENEVNVAWKGKLSQYVLMVEKPFRYNYFNPIHHKFVH